MPIEMLSVSDRLVTAVFNGTCQGVVVASLVALALRLAPRTNAATRHAAWLSTLLVMLALVVGHCCREFCPARRASALTTAAAAPYDRTQAADDSAHDQTRGVVATPLPELEPESAARVASQGVVPSVALEAPNTQDIPEGTDQEPTADAPALGSGVGETLSEVGKDSTLSRGDTLLIPLRRLGGALTHPLDWNVALASPATRLASLALLGIWLLIAAARLGGVVLRLQGIRRLKAQARPAGPELDGLFQKLRGQLAVKRPAEVRVSSGLRSPVLLGFVRPVVLLPSEGVGGEIEQVLRHELAHVQRYDDWVNLVQQGVQAVCFFHPAIWWISRQLCLEREIACDDHVLQQGGAPRSYALLLANLATRLQGNQPLLAPAVSTNNSQLKQRIDMILNPNRNRSPRLAKARLGFITCAGALLAAVAIYAAPRVVLAQDAPPAPPVPGAAAAPEALESPAVPAAPALPPVPAAAAAPAALPAPPAPLVTATQPSYDYAAPEATIVVTGDSDAPVAANQPIVKPGAKSKGNTVTIYTSRDSVTATGVGTGYPYTTPGAVAGQRAYVLRAPVQVASADPAQPRPPLAPLPPLPPNASLEERMARLEKMVEALAARPRGGLAFGDWQGFFERKKDPFFGSEDAARLNDLADQQKQLQEDIAKQQAQADPKNPQQLQAWAKRQAEFAQRQAELAKRQAELANRQAAEEMERATRNLKDAFRSKNLQNTAQARTQLDAQIESLREQMEVLERQRERLDRQVDRHEKHEKLYKERKEKQEEQEQDEDDSSDQDDSKADNQPHTDAQSKQSKDAFVAQSHAL